MKDEPFRFLDGEEFAQLALEERSAYMKRVVEYFERIGAPDKPSRSVKKPSNS